MIAVKEIKEAFLHLLFPHICAGCGSDLVNEESMLCIRCAANLPETNFQFYTGNPVEKLFWGRIPLVAATASYYFTKESLIQQLVHEFKYKGNRALGRQMGRLLGKYLIQSGRFTADALVALPLFPAKERKRGYNQAALLCDGIAEVTGIPVLKDAIVRSQHTETQTHKGRIERWQNMAGKFVVQDEQAIRNKYLLLVDDVITTGATLEACSVELLKVENTRVGVAALCIASAW